MKKYISLCFVIVFVFCLNDGLHAQSVSRPNIGLLTQACASVDFNSFNFTFTFSPESELGSNNQFIAELSDGTGSFSNPTVIYTSNPGSVTSFPASVNFSLPITTSGENYAIRLRSTDPVSTGGKSKSFPAYYKIHDTPFTINNLISTGFYCSGGSYLLTIDETNSISNDSPLQYPSLTFNWFKEISETEDVFVADGLTLSVVEPGTYFVRTNYGSCTSESVSNKVTVSEVFSDTTTSSINSSLGNPYCASEGATTLTAIKGDGYQWFKDGEEILGAINQSISVNESGEYFVIVDLGLCVTSATINLDATGFTSSINVSEVVNLNQDETFLATITTNAIGPQFQWYLDNALISDAKSDSFEVLKTGTYRAVVTQTVDCNASTEFVFRVVSLFPNTDKIPNLISPNNDGINDTWVIPQAFVSGTNTKVIIMSSQGKIVFETNDYQNNWPVNQLDFNNVNPVFYYILMKPNGETNKGSITVVK